MNKNSFYIKNIPEFIAVISEILLIKSWTAANS